MVEVRVLGPLELFDGTSVVRLRRAEQIVLAALVARSGERVAVDALVEALWPDAPPPSARKTLQGHILRLRRAVGPAAIIERDGGYRFDPEHVNVDAVSATRQFAAAREALRRGDAQTALPLLEDVNRAFRGEPYEGVPETAVPVGELQRLVELRLAVVEDSAEAHLASGGGERCIGELEAFVQANPFRERAWGLLMRALYQAGRPADALAAFGRARMLLAAELGIEPGPALRDIEQAILTHDRRLEPTGAGHRSIESSPNADPPSSPTQASAESAARRLPRGTVTFLFTDVEQSTRLVEELGDHAYADVLSELRAIISAAVEDAGGVVFGSEGDGLFCAFDSATSGTRAATVAQESIGQHSWPRPLRVRMGAHAGEALLVDGDYVGTTVHVAARIAAAAHGGQVVASDACRSLDPGHTWFDLGRHRLKGVDRPQHLHQLDTGAGHFPPLATAENVPSNIRESLDPFVGRTRECGHLVELLAHSRLVTLVGPGGVGKTRLAIETSRRLKAANPGGVYFIELAQLSREEGVEALITNTLLEQGGSGIDLWSVSSNVIRDDPTLLVLDNCEHVVDRVSSVVSQLLERFPSLRVLATSREPLHVRGERVSRVAPLSISAGDGERSAAHELFRVRAEAATDRPLLPSDDKWVGHICTALDGLPLAIELAASRTTSLAVADIATRLDDRFALLRSSRAVEDDRHRTLGAVVDWSYEMLSTDDRELFNRLSVFGGAFRLDVAETVVGVDGIAPGYVLEGLSHLVDKSLVQLTATEQGSTYRLLDTLRTYGRARLIDAGTLEAAEEHLIDFAMAVTARLERDMRTQRQDSSLAAAVRDRSSIRTALELQLSRGRYLEALRIVASVPLDTCVERIRLIDMLVGRVDTDGNDEVLGRAHLAAANTEFERAGYDASVRHAKLAASHFDRLGDQRFVAWCSFQEIFGAWGAGDIEGARSALEAARSGFDRMGERVGLANASWAAVMLEPDPIEADRLGDHAESELRSIDSPFALAHCLEARALVELRLGRSDQAAPRLSEALAILSESGNAGCTAHSLEAIAAWAVTREVNAEVLGVTAELLGAAEQLRISSGHRHRPWELEGKRAAVGALRESLPAEVLEAALIRGRGHNLGSAAELGHRVVAAVVQ